MEQHVRIISTNVHQAHAKMVVHVLMELTVIYFSFTFFDF